MGASYSRCEITLTLGPRLKQKFPIFLWVPYKSYGAFILEVKLMLNENLGGTQC
jgi:hypothetical protein